MSYLDIGLSAIRANQVALRTIGHNIANAATEGYHRQEVRLVDRLPIDRMGHSLGTGVDVARIERIVQHTVEAALARNASAAASAETRHTNWRTIETILLPGSGSLDAVGSDLFNALSRLSAEPNEPVLAREVVETAGRLAGEFNRVWSALDLLASDLIGELQAGVDAVNGLTAELGPLQERIAHAAALSREPNDFLDRRDSLVSQLAGLLDVRVSLGDAAQSLLTGAAGTMVLSPDAEPLEVVRDESEAFLRLTESERSITPTDGRLAGLLAALGDVRQVQTELGDWFDRLRFSFDHIQATGLNATGPIERAVSVRSLLSASRPLAELTATESIVAGELHVTITDTTTQQRTTHVISMDPTVDTLADVITRLDSIPGLHARWDATSGQVVLLAGSNNRFDFAGRVDQPPTSVAVTGTATAEVGGLYTGRGNAVWQVTAVDSGDIGVTVPLRLDVRDQSTGTLLRTLEVGLGYVAGEPLDLGDGVTLSLSSGSLQSGDEWTVRSVAEPDTTGLLAALGLNGFFSGIAPGEYAVHPGLVQQPALLATSRSGLAGEPGNLARLLALRDNPDTDEGSVLQQLGALLGSISLNGQTARSESEHLQTLATQWRNERDRLSGVDTNEEMLAMLRYQQAYQSVARFVSSVNETIDVLLELTR